METVRAPFFPPFFPLVIECFLGLLIRGNVDQNCPPSVNTNSCNSSDPENKTRVGRFSGRKMPARGRQLSPGGCMSRLYRILQSTT
jgi:hypothetical protein